MSRILIIGAGLSGATLAERFASSGDSVLVIDKRAHLAGNCFDHLDKQTGIRVSNYGAHLFHTNSQEVWDYLRAFSKWQGYEHQVLVKVKNQLLNLPINLNTINQFFHQKLSSAEEMRAFLAKKTKKLKDVANSEDYVLSQVGSELYEAIFQNYSLKQWALDPSELDAAVIKRNPLRFDADNRYFTDRYQALPVNGFEGLVSKMLSHQNIELRLKTDFFVFREQNDLSKFDQVFYTGAIDQYFDYAYGHLEYRSLDFHFEEHDQEFYQSNSAVNYPSLDYPFTRVIEYKYFYPPKKALAKTIISKEYPTWDGEPYYPVPRERNHLLLKKYLREAKKLEAQGIYFVGRLGTYRYLNMDQAVAEALKLFEKVKKS
ncbi:MAG: UDP-galactopyranose mutase [Candidatus Pacebacteria bacterium GW2011_GWF2_38_9]|nr:MAG: UDP-galactopyranose mutase, UDP-galactopyranose mutase [candidate division TM6 bacterium GW2011_GWF2_28_16]KKQ09330.1 MAG: UDP-galactopyranose mutase [Candidatus Pacebacteria bacterium GW2011_GWF1_36_5]KKQ88846.1 MAG: UDP-galactopyranose mutase [Candidatus Pacebacteria bacterium GW2011_GWF2_38_9]HAZ73215.1 UDP-galactopyranose mutase [Candidatus Paceibacterota bacterium]